MARSTNVSTRSLQAALLLNNAPSIVRDAVVSDPDFTNKFSLSLSATIDAFPEISIDWHSFVAACEKAFTGVTETDITTAAGASLRCQLEVIGADVHISASGHVTHAPYAVLLSEDRTARMEAVRAATNSTILSAESVEAWTKLAWEQKYSSDEYLRLLNEMDRTPEALAERLINAHELSLELLSPTDLDYWSCLLPLPSGTEDFATFLRTRLHPEIERKLGLNSERQIGRTGYSAITQLSAQAEALASAAPNDVAHLLAHHDPFSLLLVLDLAARGLTRNPDWEVLGTEALATLFDDANRLDHRCQLFSAALTLSPAGFAASPTWVRMPVYWRRLLVFTHAGVVTNALATAVDADSFFRWAQRQNGRHGYISGILERQDGPLWDWSLVGRGYIKGLVARRFLEIVNAFDDAKCPATWRSYFMELPVRNWTATEAVLSTFPGPFSDWLGFEGAKLEVDAFEITESALGRDLSPIPGLVPFTRLVEPTAAQIALLKGFVERAGKEVGGEKVVAPLIADLSSVAYVAGKRRDVELAGALADAITEAFRQLPDTGHAALLLVLIDASNSFAGREAQFEWLGRHFRRIAKVSHSRTQIVAALTALEDLRSAAGKCRPYLSQAYSLARLKYSYFQSHPAQPEA